MKAILSEIHGNLEALQAVLADAARNGATEIYCLGNLVGYGPNPIECVTLSMEWPVVLLGNFEFVAVHQNFEGWVTFVHAENSVRWFLDLVKQSEQAAHCAEFLSKLPRIHKEGKFMFVHGTPRSHVNGYLFPEDIHDGKKMERIAECFSGHCFSGHTGIPGIFTEDAAKWEYLSPKDCDDCYDLSTEKTICNVGSVGQPKDGDWRASYVLFDGNVIQFRRVGYDIETTVAKIRAYPRLDNWLGDRLRVGR